MIDGKIPLEWHEIKEFVNKIISYINYSGVKIPLRVLWLAGRLSIATFATYGIYVGLDFITTHPELYINYKYMGLSFFIFNNFAKFIQVYVLWDILTTFYNLYKDIKIHYAKD